MGYFSNKLCGIYVRSYLGLVLLLRVFLKKHSNLLSNNLPEMA